MKTLKELNSKWYWRMVKIIYSALIVVITIFVYYFLYEKIQFHEMYTPQEAKLATIAKQNGYNQERFEEEILPQYRSGRIDETGEIKKLTEQQLKENMDALEQQWAPKEDVQGYLNTLEKNEDNTFSYKEEFRPAENQSRNIQYFWWITKTLFFTIIISGLLIFITRSGSYYIIFGKVFPPK